HRRIRPRIRSSRARARDRADGRARAGRLAEPDQGRLRRSRRRPGRTGGRHRACPRHRAAARRGRRTLSGLAGPDVMRATRAVMAGAAATALAVHAVPLITTRARLRRRYMPSLAGIGSADHVAITFDDGPDPASTPAFLEELDRLGIRATFFMLGVNAVAHP